MKDSLFSNCSRLVGDKWYLTVLICIYSSTIYNELFSFFLVIYFFLLQVTHSLNSIKYWNKKKTQNKNKKNLFIQDHTNIKVIMREYCEQHYARKFNNLDEPDKFLENCKLLKHTRIESLNNPMSIIDIKLIIKNFLKENSRPNGFFRKFYQIFVEALSIWQNSLEKIKEEGMCLKSFSKASLTLIPKLDQKL